MSFISVIIGTSFLQEGLFPRAESPCPQILDLRKQIVQQQKSDQQGGRFEELIYLVRGLLLVFIEDTIFLGKNVKETN